MNKFIIVACLTVIASAKPTPPFPVQSSPGYSYNSPSSGALSANLLPPQSPPTYTVSTIGFGPTTVYRTAHQAIAPSHASLGLSHFSNGGSLALGSSYSAASPVIYTNHRTGSSVSSAYNSFGSNSHSGSGT